MTKEQEEAIKILVNMKKENESLAMRISNNRLDFRIVWSESDLKNMAKTSQECAKKIRAIETVLSMLEEKDKVIDNSTQQIPNITRNKTYSGSFEGLLLIEEELKKRDNIITQLINELYNLAILINEEYVVDEYLLNKETIKEHFLKRKEK